MEACGYVVYSFHQKLGKGVDQETTAYREGRGERRNDNCNMVEKVVQCLRCSRRCEMVGFRNLSSDPQRRLENHLDECLVVGSISTDDYRILAVFHSHTLGDVPLSVLGCTGRANVPDRLLADGIGRTVEEKLENEVHQHNGIR